MRWPLVLVMLLSACAQSNKPSAPPSSGNAAATDPSKGGDAPQTDDDGPLTWHTLTANGETVEYATVGTPGGGPVLLALPPGPQTREMVAAGLDPWADAMAEDGWFVVSPVSPSGLFFTDSAGIVPAFVDAAAATHGFEPTGLHVFGMSNGGISAFTAAIAEPDRFAAVVTMPGRPTDEDMEGLDALSQVPVTIVVGADDEAFWVEGAVAAEAKLQAAGGSIVLTTLPGTGHAAHIAYDWPALRELFAPPTTSAPEPPVAAETSAPSAAP